MSEREIAENLVPLAWGMSVGFMVGRPWVRALPRRLLRRLRRPRRIERRNPSRIAIQVECRNHPKNDSSVARTLADRLR